jgi:ABC exporter DevB family membrane fusion protein
LDPTFRKIDVDLATARYAEASENLDAERATAQTRLSSATLALRQATEGAAIELEAQEKRVEFLRLDLQQASNDLARLATLSKSSESIVSEQQLEHQQLLRDKSAAETDSAEAALKQLQQAARFDQETAEANVRAAEVALEAVDKRSNLQALKVQLQLAQERLGRTVIIAPISGTVLKIYTRVGESIAEKPVLQMADLSKFDCVAEVFEADIKLVSVGDLVQVRSRAFLGSFDDTYVTGRVKRIGNAMPNRELTPISPLEPVDKHVVQVEIDLADKTREMVELLGESDTGDVLNKAQALVNLEVEVTFPEQSELSVSGLAR